MSYDIISMKSIAKKLNDLTYTDYFYRLMLIARSIYKWENLPNNIDEKWIERYLFTDGKCMFFNDNEKGFMITKCSEAGQLNFYDEPTMLRGYGTDYVGDVLTNNEECILVRNNDEMIPTSPTIQLFALRLAEISRTIDVNINAQKTPLVILCNEKQRMTLKNLYKQYEGNEPAIFGSKDLDLQDISVLKTDAPFVADKLQIQKHAIWNECMTFLGIGNANQDKKERLVADEVSANNEQIEYSAQVMLKERQNAAERINKLFGTNINVTMRSLSELSILLGDKLKGNLERDKGGIEQ